MKAFRRTCLRIFSSLKPALIVCATAALSGSVAHAQGTMDFSGAQALMGTFKTFAIYAGAVICFGGLIFAGIRMMSGRFTEAIPGLFGALFGAAVLGWGAGWIGPSSLTIEKRFDRVHFIELVAEKLERPSCGQGQPELQSL